MPRIPESSWFSMSTPWFGLRNSACAEPIALCVVASVTSFSGLPQSAVNPLHPGFVFTTGCAAERPSSTTPTPSRGDPDQQQRAEHDGDQPAPQRADARQLRRASARGR